MKSNYIKKQYDKALFIQSFNRPEHLPLSDEKSLMRSIALSRWRLASKRIELFPAPCKNILVYELLGH